MGVKIKLRIIYYQTISIPKCGRVMLNSAIVSVFSFHKAQNYAYPCNRNPKISKITLLLNLNQSRIEEWLLAFLAGTSFSFGRDEFETHFLLDLSVFLGLRWLLSDSCSFFSFLCSAYHLFLIRWIIVRFSDLCSIVA